MHLKVISSVHASTVLIICCVFMNTFFGRQAGLNKGGDDTLRFLRVVGEGLI